mmetsp:Transcript_29403/g.70987  ORF Transcript_29403/g.70987 Transcript_29403/m.70987 type:complete len:248 (+) Transcript_29403:4099-4842(+)
MARNAERLMLHSLQKYLDRNVALRGQPYNSAISPNDVPEYSVALWVSPSYTSMVPLSMTKKASPSSPSLIIVLPADASDGAKTSTNSASSSFEQALNKMLAAMASCMRRLADSGLGTTTLTYLASELRLTMARRPSSRSPRLLPPFFNLGARDLFAEDVPPPPPPPPSSADCCCRCCCCSDIPVVPSSAIDGPGPPPMPSVESTRANELRRRMLGPDGRLEDDAALGRSPAVVDVVAIVDAIAPPSP